MIIKKGEAKQTALSFLCPGLESNQHDLIRPPGPQPGASTNSATWAFLLNRGACHGNIKLYLSYYAPDSTPDFFGAANLTLKIKKKNKIITYSGLDWCFIADMDILQEKKMN